MKKKVFVVLAVLTLALLAITAIAQGPYSYRDTGSGLVTYQPLGFEGSAGAGADVVVKRPGAGHLAILNGSQSAVAPDIIGTKTLSGGTGTVTFNTAYTVAPLCFATDITAAAAVRTSTTTTALTITGTTTDVIAYLCFANPN